ncbi:hypothetical protein [Streptomyces sp. NPDC001759]
MTLARGSCGPAQTFAVAEGGRISGFPVMMRSARAVQDLAAEAAKRTAAG